MNGEEDPESRIRELEQPLADAARASEASATPSPGKWAPPLGPPIRTAPPLPYGGSIQNAPTGTAFQGRRLWIRLALFVIGVVSLPIVIFFLSTRPVTHSGLTAPAPAPSSSPQRPTAAIPSMPTVAIPTPPAPTTTAPASDNATVSGINEARTIACNGGTVNVSGITNTVTVTGHCASVLVSGIQNQVIVDAADTIQASGSGNRVTFHNGVPKILSSGLDNVVGRG